MYNAADLEAAPRMKSHLQKLLILILMFAMTFSSIIILLARAEPEAVRPSVRVTISNYQSYPSGFGYSQLYSAFVDGTPAKLLCETCSYTLANGTYWGRWDKSKLVIRSWETFKQEKYHDQKFKVSFQEPSQTYLKFSDHSN
jgi:hypothetical protein